MAIENKTVLKINFVLVNFDLLSLEGEMEGFQEHAGTEVIPTMMTPVMGQPVTPLVPGTRLELPQERVSLTVLPGRSTVEREYPTESDLPRLADLVDFAIGNTQNKSSLPTAFGYNIDFVYDQTSGRPALEYIGSRLFGSVTATLPGFNLVGGAARLVYAGQSGVWNLRFEPRLNDERASRVYLSMNYHKTEQRLPDREETLCSFREVWKQGHDLITRLDDINS